MSDRQKRFEHVEVVGDFLEGEVAQEVKHIAHAEMELTQKFNLTGLLHRVIALIETAFGSGDCMGIKGPVEL